MLCLLLLSGAGRACAGARQASGAVDAQPGMARDLDGRRVRLMPQADGQAVVLVFVASDCPISNRYLPQLVRLRKSLAGQGVAFWFVYPNLTESIAGIRAHQAGYGASGEVLRDDDRALARLTGAKVTPEASVLVRRGEELRVMYTGRIDDRYLSIGSERPQATRHELEAAIEAVLAGRPVSAPGGPPVGCGIVGTR